MTENRPQRNGVKITVVGDSNVGKSCLLRVYKYGLYMDAYNPKPFEDQYEDTITLDSQQFDLELWDTAAQDDYERLRALCYPKTMCFLICYSIQSHESYENVKSKWAPEVRHHVPNATIIVVGTKVDLRDVDDPNMTMLTEEDGQMMNELIRADKYMECSALRNQGVKEVIYAAVHYSKMRNIKRTQRSCAIL